MSTTVDSVDINPGDGVAVDSSGMTSLRAAVMEANALAGADTVELPAGTYTLSIAGVGESAGATGDLDITESLTITGAGRDATIINANQLDRVLHVIGAGTVVSISHLTITGGRAPDGSGSGPDGLENDGGGILNERGTLSIDSVAIRGNQTGYGYWGGRGGGIHASLGPLTITNSLIADNVTGRGKVIGGIGGGIMVHSTTAMIRDSVISNNQTGDGDPTWNGSGGKGAGIASEGGNNVPAEGLTIIDTTISGNIAGTNTPGDGGGIYVSNGLILENSVVSGNTAGFQGGGIYVGLGTVERIVNSVIHDNAARGGRGGGGIHQNTGSTVRLISGTTISGNTSTSDWSGSGGGGIFSFGAIETIVNSTISGNSTNGRGGGFNLNRIVDRIVNTTIAGNAAVEGGGAFLMDFGNFTPTIGLLQNTIIADNIATGSDAHDFRQFGQVTATLHNLIETAQGHSITDGADGNIVGWDPQLGPLGDYGGSTMTHALAQGSRALDAGRNTGAPTTDQRGLPRPVNGAVDIGAYEWQPGDDYFRVAPEATLTAAAPGILANDGLAGSATATLLSNVSHGVLALNSDGSFQYTPEAGFTGVDAFSYQAGDGTRLLTASVTISVNEAPAAERDYYRVDGNGTLAVSGPGVLANDSDPDGDQLTATLISNPVHGALTFNSDGSFSYVPQAGFKGFDSFTYAASDGLLASAGAAVTIFVNDQPVTAGDAYRVNEDRTLIVPGPGVLANDADPEGEPLTALLVTGPFSGTLVFNANGSFTYTPKADFYGTDSFSYQADDEHGGSSPATVTLTIDPVNDPPVSLSETYTVSEDGKLTVGAALGLLANDTDTEGDPLTAILALAPRNGTVTLNPDGSFVYEPNADFFGTDFIGYKAHDGTSDGKALSAIVKVAPIADAPVASDDQYSVEQGGTLTVRAAGFNRLKMVSEPGDYIGQGRTYDYTDAEGDFTGREGYSNGVRVTFQNRSSLSDHWMTDFAAPYAQELERGTYLDARRLLPPPDWHPGMDIHGQARGSNSLSGYFVVHQAVHGADGELLNFLADFEQRSGSSTGVLRGTVEFSAAPNPEAGVLGNDRDPDRTRLTAVLLAGPSNGILSFNSDGTFTYRPNAGFSGTDTFTYKLNDGTADSNVATVTIMVDPVNSAPVATGQSVATNEDTALHGRVSAEDADGDVLDFIVVDAPAHGRLKLLESGRFDYTPDIDFYGTDSFTFKAADGVLESNVATVTLTVHPTADRPTVSNQSNGTDEDTPVTGALAGTDPDGDVLTFELVSGPASGSVIVSDNGSYTYTPNADFHGTDSFTYRARDGELVSNIATVTVAVAPVEDDPVALDDQYTVRQGETLNIIAAGFNRLQMVGEPGDYVGAGKTYDYADADGIFTGSRSTSNTVQIGYRDETDIFDYWNLRFDAHYSQELTRGTYLGAVSSRSFGDPRPGLFVWGQGRSNPSAGRFVVHQAVYASDGRLLNFLADFEQHSVSSTALLTGTVEFNAAPNASAGLLGNDANPDQKRLTALLVSGPSQGTLTLNEDGTFAYTPAAGFSGIDTFAYRINDGAVDSNVATVTITVGPSNSVPVAEDQSLTAGEDTVLHANASATDADGDTLDFAVVTGPTNGTLVLMETGRFSYVPNPNFHGSDSFTFKASDGLLESAVATVSIAVDSINDVPVVASQSRSTPEDTALSGTLTATDADGDELTFGFLRAPASGTVLITSEGSYTYTPNANFRGRDSFSFTADDGQAVRSGSVTLTVTSVEDVPVAVDDAYQVNEDAVLAASVAAAGVLGNDIEPDGDPRVATLVTGPSNGVLLFKADGTFTYTPNANFHGTDTFTYWFSDGKADSNVATATIQVEPVNDGAVALGGAYVADEDTPLSVTGPGLLGNDSDIDGDTLSVVLVSGPSNGGLVLDADGSFTYTPNSNFNGADSFTYRANDGTAESNIATVSITIGAVNDAPIAQGTSLAVVKNGSIDVDLRTLVNDLETADDDLIFSVGNPVNGAVSLQADGYTARFTPNADYAGPASFTYSVTDTGDGSAAATTVGPVTVALDVFAAGSIRGMTWNDRDGNGLRNTGEPVMEGVTIYLDLNDNGSLDTGEPTEVTNANGVYVFDELAPGEYVVREVVPAGFGQTRPGHPNDFFYGIYSGSLVKVDAVTGDFSRYLGSGVQNGLHGLTLTNAGELFAISGQGTDSLYSIDRITGAATLVGPTGRELAFGLTYDALTDTIYGLGEHAFGTVGLISYERLTGATTAIGNAITTLTATSGVAFDPIQRRVIAFDNFDDEFYAFDLSGNATRLSSIAGLASYGFTHTGSEFVMQVAGGQLISVNPDTYAQSPYLTIVGGPTGEFEALEFAQGGPLGYQVTLTSGETEESLDFYNWKPNAVPAAQPDSYTIDEDGVLTVSAAAGVLANDSDDDGDPLTAVFAEGGLGSVTLNADGSFTYTPPANYSGPAHFQYRASDGFDESQNVTVTIIVNAVNDAPTLDAIANPAAIDEDAGQQTISLGGISAGGGESQVLRVTATSSNPGLIPDPVVTYASPDATGSLSYTPAADQNGSAVITVTVTDAGLDGTLGTADDGSTSRTFTVTVNANNDAPVAADDAAATTAGTAVTIDVLANDTDVEQQDLSVSSITQGSHGSVVINGDGTVTYTPNLGFSGTDSFTYTGSDGTLDSNVATVIVQISGAPVQILDDGDAGFSASGNWKFLSGQGHQSDIHYSVKGTGADVATWTFSGLQAGTYQVAATWNPYSNRATDSPFTVLEGANPLNTILVNQELAPDDFTDAGAAWESLGEFTITGSTLVVQLSDAADEYVIADAIRIEKLQVSGSLSVTLDAGSISENGGAATGTVSRTGGTSQELVVTLASSDTTEATVPGSVTIPAGAPSATFLITAQDDAQADGTQTVTITAAAAGLTGGSALVEVTDDEPTPQALIIDNGDAGFSTIGNWTSLADQGHQSDIHYSARGSGADVATWTFTGLQAGTYRVAATWNPHSNRATDSPFAVLDGANPLNTILVNQELAPDDFTGAGAAWESLGEFTITGSTLVVQLSDAADEYVIADAIRIEKLQVSGSLSVTLDAGSISENGGAATGTVSRTGGTSQELVVTLASSDTSEATVPASVTIAGGASSATFVIGAQDDPEADGTQTVTITASADGLVSASSSLDVTDDEPVPQVRIIDNGDAGFSTSGNWTFLSGQGHQSDIHYSARGSGADVATWTFSGLQVGTYQVAATWNPHSNRATDSPFTVLDGASPLNTVLVNQELAPDDFTDAEAAWESLGEFTITGSTLAVQLSDAANEYVIADAVRVERVQTGATLESGPSASLSSMQTAADSFKTEAQPTTQSSALGWWIESGSPQSGRSDGSDAPVWIADDFPLMAANAETPVLNAGRATARLSLGDDPTDRWLRSAGSGLLEPRDLDRLFTDAEQLAMILDIGLSKCDV